MIKPKWNDAPEWADYVAMDVGGAWWWYEFKPAYTHSSETWDVIDDGWARGATPHSLEPIETLEKRP